MNASAASVMIALNASDAGLMSAISLMFFALLFLFQSEPVNWRFFAGRSRKLYAPNTGFPCPLPPVQATFVDDHAARTHAVHETGMQTILGHLKVDGWHAGLGVRVYEPYKLPLHAAVL